MFMNEYEITDLKYAFDADEHPNLSRGATVLANLRDWTDRNSDGWPYWSKPSRAANRLMELLNAAQSEYFKGNEVTDCTSADLKAALAPVKRFLTTQDVDHSEVLG